MSRMIYIIGEINDEMVHSFAVSLNELVTKRSPQINVVLSSGGGDSYASLAISDMIKLCPAEVHITAYGSCQSAAVLILASGDHRSASKNTWFMVHEDSVEQSGRTEDIAKVSRQMQREEDQWAKLMDTYTTNRADIWSYMSKAEHYFEVKEALSMGLIDEILEEKQ